MKAWPVVQGVEWVGVMDWDRRMFDELIPLPDGTSYNAYLVRGSEKTALIDGVDPPFIGQLFAKLDSAGVSKIDYIVSNHTEQDHSGAIPALMAKFPEAKVLCTPRAVEMLQDHLGLSPDRLQGRTWST